MMPITRKKIVAAILTAIAALCLALAACEGSSLFIKFEAGSSADAPADPPPIDPVPGLVEETVPEFPDPPE